jgi:alanine-glyoxylate transaminase/serine-glyoxylate transaminase/serine-pyruvate transaminase
MGPGPSDVPTRVLEALARPTIGHMDPAFMRVMDQTRSMLQQVFQTRNAMTLACSGTGSAGAQMLMDNLVEPDDVCLIGINGVFGGRLTDKAQRAGGIVHNLEAPWGEVFEQDAVIAKIDELKPRLVALVHAETSTGALQPVDRIGEAVHRHGGLFVLDCVTSLGGLPVKIDEWGVDAAYSGTQKCLSCPPGLAPVTLSERAMDKVRGRATRPNSWYLDLNLVGNYWDGDRAYHHTAPVNMVFALHAVLELVLEEGLEARFARHRAMHEKLVALLGDLGIEPAVREAIRLPMLNAVRVPAGLDEKAARRRMLEAFNLEIGAGLGALAGKVWRIGLMGHSARPENLDLLDRALRAVLSDAGVQASVG